MTAGRAPAAACQASTARVAARVDHHVGSEALGERAARRREVGGDDRLGATEAERRDHREAHRAAADDEGRVARLEAGLHDGVQADGHGLGQRGVLGREAVRHRQQEELREDHRLAVAAGIVVRVADGLDASRSDRERHRHDARPRGVHALRVRAEVDHLGAELVSHHHVARDVQREGHARLVRGLDHLVGVGERVKVRAADAAGEGADEHLAGARLGVGDGVDREAAASHHRGAHGYSGASTPAAASARSSCVSVEP